MTARTPRPPTVIRGGKRRSRALPRPARERATPCGLTWSRRGERVGTPLSGSARTAPPTVRGDQSPRPSPNAIPGISDQQTPIATRRVPSEAGSPRFVGFHVTACLTFRQRQVPRCSPPAPRRCAESPRMRLRQGPPLQTVHTRVRSAMPLRCTTPLWTARTFHPSRFRSDRRSLAGDQELRMAQVNPGSTVRGIFSGREGHGRGNGHGKVPP